MFHQIIFRISHTCKYLNNENSEVRYSCFTNWNFDIKLVAFEPVRIKLEGNERKLGNFREIFKPLNEVEVEDEN